MGEKIQTSRIEDWIDIYEDQTTGWFLNHAWELSGRLGTNFVVFYLALGYFEGWAQYRWGVDSTDRSQEFFRRALLDVFEMQGPEADAISALFYREARCGVLHDAHLHGEIVFNRELPYAMLPYAHRDTGQPVYILINPRRFVAVIGHHFKRYITALREPSNSELRENFSATWRRLHKQPVPATLAPSSARPLHPYA